MDPSRLKIDYRKLLSIPVRDRVAAAQSGAISEIINGLTPTQRANLFPRYYEEKLPDISGFTKAMSGGLNRFNSRPATGESTTYGPAPGGGPRGGDAAMKKASSIPAWQKRLQEQNPDLQFMEPPKGKAGAYRPPYQLTEDDLTDAFFETVAGEAHLSDQASVDAVIHNMMNRVQSGGVWGPDANLHQVATAPGQYVGRRKLTAEQRKMIEERAREIASGMVPDPTKGADEYRANWYIFGEGRGKTAYRRAEAQGFNDQGGNIYFKNPDAQRGKFSSYTAEELQEMEAKRIADEKASGKEPTVVETLPPNSPPELIKLYDNLVTVEQKNNLVKAVKRHPGKLDQIVETVTSEAGFSFKPTGKRVYEPKEELKEKTQYAAEMAGIKRVEAYSGGQDQHIREQLGSSDRHTIKEGTPGAVDAFFIDVDENGNEFKLDATNPAHAAKIAKFYEEFARVTEGAGLGANYMEGGNGIDPTRFHVGGPNNPGDRATTWGNTPQYLVEAHARGTDLQSQDKKAGVDPLAEWKRKKEEERLAAAKKAETPPTPTATSEPVPIEAPITISEPPRDYRAPTLNQGGNVGENTTVIDDRTGEILAKANHREELIVQPKYRPEDKLEYEREIKQEPTMEPEQSKEEPKNEAAMRQPTPTPRTKMASDAYSGLNHGTLSPSQLRAYRDRGENLHREGTSYV